MILFSDLDSTLIYSRKRLINCEKINSVETINNKEMSFMSDISLKHFRALCDQNKLIPVTTRDIDRYKRIHGFHEFGISHAITTNGGKVLESNKLDMVYESIISDKVNNECMDKNDIMKIFNTINSKTWVDNIGIADDLFYYGIVNGDNIPYDELKCFIDEIKNYKWDTILHGRKIYMIPSCVNKWDAVKYVKNKIQCSETICSGDSLMDLEMIENADYAIVPCHGEVINSIKRTDNIYSTKREGINSAQEILEKAIELINMTYSYNEGN